MFVVDSSGNSVNTKQVWCSEKTISVRGVLKISSQILSEIYAHRVKLDHHAGQAVACSQLDAISSPLTFGESYWPSLFWVRSNH